MKIKVYKLNAVGETDVEVPMGSKVLCVTAFPGFMRPTDEVIDPYLHVLIDEEYENDPIMTDTIVVGAFKEGEQVKWGSSMYEKQKHMGCFDLKRGEMPTHFFIRK